MLDAFNRCQYDVVLPSGEQVIQDGSLTTGIQNYKEFFQSLAGLVGAGQNFTGNGVLHPLPAGRRRLPRCSTGTAPGDTGARFGNATARRRRYAPGAAVRSRPTSPTPPVTSSRVPNLNSAATGRPGRAREAPDQEAGAGLRGVIVLFVVAIGVAGYILSNQRFYLPAWVPFIGTDFYEVKAELPTAQAVVPGPGPDGEHRRREGRRGGRGERSRTAAPSSRCRSRTSTSRSTRTPRSCCGPKTGLKDMILALDPGTERPARSGGRPRTGGQHAARREPGRGARVARRRHPRLPADPAERRRHGLPRTKLDSQASSRSRRTCARRSSASSPPRATARSSRSG